MLVISGPKLQNVTDIMNYFQEFDVRFCGADVTVVEMFETFKQHPFTHQQPNKARCRLEKKHVALVNPTQNQSRVIEEQIFIWETKIEFDHKASWRDQSLGGGAPPINWHRVSEA